MFPIRRIFVTTGLLLIFVLSSFCPNPQPTLEGIYLSQVGVQEQPRGSNWGKQVQRYLKAVNFKTPAPWCAAFVRFCLDSAGIKSTVTAYSPTAHNAKNLVYHKSQFIKQMEPGDVFTIYYTSMKRIGHTGFVHRKVNSSICETVEGNSNDEGSREGYEVCKRKRSFHSLYSISRWR